MLLTAMPCCSSVEEFCAIAITVNKTRQGTPNFHNFGILVIGELQKGRLKMTFSYGCSKGLLPAISVTPPPPRMQQARLGWRTVSCNFSPRRHGGPYRNVFVPFLSYRRSRQPEDLRGCRKVRSLFLEASP